MGILRWYKHDPRAFLIATEGMSLELRGAYITILDWLYVHDGKVRDDRKQFCRWLDVTPKRWARVRADLIKQGKLYAIDGNLRNERVDREMYQAALRRQRYKNNVFPFKKPPKK